MDREKRLRRVALLCCHFARNCAYYRAGWDGKETKARNEFWATVQGNFIDIAVLEWLKLFGDHKDKHHWRKIVEDKDSFKQEMLAKCEISESELAHTRDLLKEYRDKFIAHLDSEEMMCIPVLDIPIKVMKFYYEYIAHELVETGLGDLPIDIELYYQSCFRAAKMRFGKQKEVRFGREGAGLNGTKISEEASPSF